MSVEDLQKHMHQRPKIENCLSPEDKMHGVVFLEWVAELDKKFVAFTHANAIIPRSVYDNKEVVETLKDLFKCLLGEEVVVVPKQKLKELSDRYHCGTSKERFYVICGFLKELFKET